MTTATLPGFKGAVLGGFKMIRVATYTRVSTLEQAEEGYSINEQQDKLEKYCELKDWTITHRYSDPGFSGSNIKRPGISELVAAAKQGDFDLVLVYKLDRLSRSQKDTLYLIEDVFQANQIEFVSLSENFDTSTPFGKAMIGILSVFAQLEREQIKERMTMGKIGRAKSGKAMGWSKIPFGYSLVDDVYEVDEFQATIVKRIFSEYLSGESPATIAKALNSEGHLGKGKPWSWKTVKDVLMNVIYTGYISFKGELYPGMHKPIIDMETYKKTQTQIEIRRVNADNPRPFRAKYMLSGLLKCHYCGATLRIAVSVNRRTKARSYRYNCPSSHPRKSSTYKTKAVCPFKLVYKDEMEKRVIAEIEKLPKNFKQEKEPMVDLDAIKKQIKFIKTKQSKLMDLYLVDGIDMEELNQRNGEFNKQIKGLEKKLSSTPTKLDVTEVLNRAKNISELTYDEQKKLVKLLIDEIEVGNDSIKIHWRF